MLAHATVDKLTALRLPALAEDHAIANAELQGRSRTTERPEQRPDPRRERPRRDSQAHYQERLSHRRSRGPRPETAGPGRRRT